MNAIRRILCPTDFTEFSRRALWHAVTLARWKGCELVVLHVRQPAEVPVHAAASVRAWSGSRDAVTKDPGRARAEAALKAFVEPAFGTGVEMRTVIQEGVEIDEILREVRALGADLLVMGTHGRGGFERFMLGSVTEQVLRRADCPVLVVPSPHGGSEEVEEDSPAGPGSPYAHIVCPLDFSETSLAALHQAVRMAREAGARLTVVHAVELPPSRIGEPDAAPLAELRRRLSDGAVERVMEVLARESWNGMPVDSVVLAGKAYQEILSVAEDLFADLIVMGVSGRADADRALFGSTVQHVTRAAVCPVLTVHAA
ncbi:MAG: universal stress protein [Candidatus Polarisedimenticolia bacterium]